MNPDPAPILTIDNISQVEWWLILIGVLGLVGIVFGVGYGIIRAARYPAPALLVMALSMLTLLAIVGYVVTSADELATLTGVGMGALAGAVNAVFNNPEKKQSEALKMTEIAEDYRDHPTGNDPGGES